MLSKKIIPFLIISILCYFSIVNCTNNHQNNDFKDFSIKDTASITKFRISDTEGNTITINRDNNSKIWMIDGTDFRASKPTVDLIMETFYRIRVKQDVANSALNTVINRLSVRHKKVEIFLKEDSPYKSWYIGSPTQDHTGTYMLLEIGENKSSKPYVTYKPGMYGTLEVRFFTDWKGWRSPRVFDYVNPKNIQKISTNFIGNEKESYTITYENDSLNFYDNDNNLVTDYNEIQVKHYLTHFNNISYNKIIFEKQIIIDSIFNSNRFVSFELKDVNNNIKKVDFWRIKDENSPNGWDPEYGYIRVNNNNELLRAQYFNWEILFKPLSFFTL
tara:strand:+ start:126 stop:1118 length:993 start_codon:yes stop_codon:yes gene_type:complete